jgi:uncharacterized protein YbjT (DUF2867 family)
MKYLLIGSLGHITKPLASVLLAGGHDVTIVSSSKDREPSIAALGAKAAIGSVDDVAFLSKAFTGADAVYTMVPPVWDAKDWKAHIHAVGQHLAAAIQASGVKKVVNLSSIGAHMPAGCGPVSGLYRAEQALNALSNVDIKHLRPGYFYENFYSNIGMIKNAGFFGNNYGGDTPIVMTDPNDIAVIAAEELSNLHFTGKSIRYIVSDERTSKQVAVAIGAAIGNPGLPYVEFSDEDFVKGAMQAGLSEDVARNYAEMGGAIRNGQMIADYKKHPKIEGKTKLEDFAKEFAVVYGKA